MRQFFTSLRFRLISIVLLAVFPAIVLILYTGFEQRRLAALEAQKDARRMVDLASLNQARVIQEIHRLLATLADHPIILSEDKRKCSDFLAELLKKYPYYLNLGVVRPDGALACSALPFSGEMDLSDRGFFLRAIKTKGFAIGGCQIGRLTGKASLNFGYAVPDAQGRVHSVLFAALDLAWLSDLAGHLRLPEGSALTVVDCNGAVIARYPNPELWVGKRIPDTPIIKFVKEQKEEGVTEATGMDGVRRLYAFVPLDHESPHSLFLYTGIPTKVVFAGANQALTRNLIALAVVSILVLAAARLFGYLFVMRWVDILVGAAERLASGDLSVRTGLGHGSGEISQLGQAFDKMAHSLQKRGIERDEMEEALRRARDELEGRVRERTAELTAANEELRRGTEKLKLFAYSVMHDLKSPAIGAYGLTQLLRKQYGDVLDEKARHYCDQIVRASEHVAGLVEKINVYIATKEMRLNVENINLAELLHIVREEFSARLNLHRIKLREPGDAFEIRADRLSLLRVFRNYIDNALKYGGEQLSEIRIGYERTEDFHIFSVSDDGAGIRKEHSEKIFDPFERNGSSRGIEGSGLGLAIVREIAAQHGGEVWMEPGAERGATFYFSIAANL